MSHRDGEGDASSLGEPVVGGAGARGKDGQYLGRSDQVSHTLHLLEQCRFRIRLLRHLFNPLIVFLDAFVDDRLDARTLARLARIDPELLSPVKYRSAQAQLHLAEIRARAGLVSARTALVNAARGLVKSYGDRRETTSELSAGLREALDPLLREVESLKDPQRFRKSRDARCFVGLQPGRRNSGESEPQMHSSKEYLRTLLVQGAHYILGPFGEDSDLRRWGLKLSARGGKNAKKRAVVAVARKLAVLLHRLWVSGEVYEPLRNSQKAMSTAA